MVGELPRVRLARALLRRYPFPRGGHLLFRVLRRAFVLPREPVIDTDDALIHADLDEYIQAYVFCRGFDDADVPVLRALLRPGDRFIDVGANIGLYSFVAARVVGPLGTVHAFEPLPEAMGRLRSNIEMNALTNIRAYDLALSDAAGETTLYPATNRNLGMGSFSSAGDKGPGITVATAALDDLVDAGTIDGCDVVKLDIEGAEPLALRGMARLLQRRQPRALLVEVSRGLLVDLGFDIRDTLDPVSANGYEWHRVRDGRLVRLEGPVGRHENLWALRRDERHR